MGLGLIHRNDSFSFCYYRQAFKRLSKGTRCEEKGSQCNGPQKNQKEFSGKDYDIVKNSLGYTGNLVSLFSDVVVVVEGKEDTGFYPAIFEILKQNEGKLISFVGTVGGGNGNFHVSYNFFRLMGFEDIFIICDLDCLFDTNFKELMKVKSIDEVFIDDFRKEIRFTDSGQPGIEYVLKNIDLIDRKKLDAKINELLDFGIIVLRHGTPENYYSEKFTNKYNGYNLKRLWEFLENKEDLQYEDDLRVIVERVSARKG